MAFPGGDERSCGPARPEELAALDALWATSFDIPAARRALWLAALPRVRVLRLDGRVRAACQLAPLSIATALGARRCLWLRALAVDPAWRGAGLGTRLLAHARAFALRHERPLALRSAPRELYARAGLAIAGRVRGWILDPRDLDPLAGRRELGPSLATAPVLGVRWASLGAAARRCAEASGAAVPIPGPRLRRLLARHGVSLSSAAGPACALLAREGLPWLAAPDRASACALLDLGVRAAPSTARRLDLWPESFGAPEHARPRDLGPWWTDASAWRGDLPAATLSCLD
jgi:GNAT superfamily N-acetyltransferase